MTGYVEIARSLPRPTEDQTRAFARFITGAHSWYKHLPVLEDCPFYFYLDPHAGCDLIQESEDEFRFCEKTEDTLKFHYTWQTTTDYRRRFGHWNYAQSYGLRFTITTKDYTLDPDGEPLQIGVPELGWIDVPERLKAAGCAHVNALMYDQIGYLEDPAVTTMTDLHQENLGCFGYIAHPPHLGNGCGRVLYRAQREADLEQPEEALSKLPPAISEALVPMIEFWDSDAYLQEFRDTGKALSEYYKNTSGKSQKKDPADVTQKQNPWDDEIYLSLQKSTRVQWEQTHARQQERKLLAPLIAAISGERQRQIDGMAHAMLRFLEALEASE